MSGILYSWLSLKELPDATFPGMLRELMILDFPLVVSAEFTIPDQTKVMRPTKAAYAKCRPPNATSTAGTVSMWTPRLLKTSCRGAPACDIEFPQDLPAQPADRSFVLQTLPYPRRSRRPTDLAERRQR